MMDAETLYALLPAIYRVRDAEQGYPLRDLVAVMAEQSLILEEDLAQFYDDQFIETCADWVVPYIGDLVGYRALPNPVANLSARAEVGNQIGAQRRKGTATMLEQLARDVTGWNGRVVEFFQQLAMTQFLNCVRPDRTTPDLRQWQPLEQLNSPFNTLSHTAEVRRIARQRGRYNIPNIGIFLWRLNSYPLTESPAFQVDQRRYLFSPLGHSAPLFTNPATEAEITQLATPLNVPAPISRRVLANTLEAYYGQDRSFWIAIDGVPVQPASNQPLSDLIKVCNLEDLRDGAGNVIGWNHLPSDKIAIDPELGRIALPQPASEVTVSYHYGFSADLGGGEYERQASLNLTLAPVEPITAPSPIQPVIQPALDRIVESGGVVEIRDSHRYRESLSLTVAAGRSLELRAANECRPLLISDTLQIQADEDSTITLNGLLISGSPLRITQTSESLIHWTLRLRHCTLVPTLTAPSLILSPVNASITLEIDHCILGSLRINDNVTVYIRNSIVDALSPTAVAYSDSDGIEAGGSLIVESSTLIGKVHARTLTAANTIFLSQLDASDPWTAPVIAQQRQQGCVRFSYVPLSAQVPRRYRCQPEVEVDALRVLPQFTSLRYGDPGYAQLSRRCAVEICRGADDESEMGAFHHLYQPQREANLRVRLNEYLRFGLEAGIFYVT
jgi:hypothetical protein